MADQLSLAPGWCGAGAKHPLLWWMEEEIYWQHYLELWRKTEAVQWELELDAPWLSLAMSVPYLSHTGHTCVPGAACASCCSTNVLVPFPEHLEQPESPVPGLGGCCFSELAG